MYLLTSKQPLPRPHNPPSPLPPRAHCLWPPTSPALSPVFLRISLPRKPTDDPNYRPLLDSSLQTNFRSFIPPPQNLLPDSPPSQPTPAPKPAAWPHLSAPRTHLASSSSMLVRASCSGSNGSQSCSSKYDAMTAELSDTAALGPAGLRPRSAGQ